MKSIKPLGLILKTSKISNCMLYPFMMIDIYKPKEEHMVKKFILISAV